MKKADKVSRLRVSFIAAFGCAAICLGILSICFVKNVSPRRLPAIAIEQIYPELKSYSVLKGLERRLDLPNVSAFQALTNYIDSAWSVDTIGIELELKDAYKLETMRARAVEQKILGPDEKAYVPASISYGGQEFKAKVRLKGTRADHFSSPNKASLHVKLKNGEKILGMSRFNLMAPETRGYHYESLYMDHLRFEGLMARRYDFINATFNGENWGIRGIEEHTDDSLIRFHGRQPGVICEFEEAPDVEYLSRNGWGTFHTNWRKSPIGVLKQSGRRASSYGPWSEVGKQLLKGFQQGYLKASEVFDVQKLATALAVAELWGCWHVLEWEDLYFYLDPKTLKFELIGSDAGVNFVESSGPIREFLFDNNISSAFLQDDMIRAEFIKQLHRICQKERMAALVDLLKKKEGSYLKKLHRDSPFLPASDHQRLLDRADKLLTLSEENIRSTNWVHGVKKDFKRSANPRFLALQGVEKELPKPYIVAHLKRDPKQATLQLDNGLYSGMRQRVAPVPISLDLKVTGLFWVEGSKELPIEGDVSYPLILKPEGASVRVLVFLPDIFESGRPKLGVHLEGRAEPVICDIFPYIEASREHPLKGVASTQ